MVQASELSFRDGRIETVVAVGTYRLSAVKKAAYRSAKLCTVILGALDEASLQLTFVFRPGTSEVNAREAVRLFFQELMDQELREQIAEETAPLRALILAQAFSKTDLLKHE